MAYFLKKTNNKKGTYLQIYESFYDPKRRQTAHKSYKPIGYVHELIEKGIDDPIAYYKSEVSKLNEEFHAEKNVKKVQKIANETPEKFLGYFPAKNINDALSVKKYIDLMQTSTDFRFNVFEMMSALVYSRLVCPCSKSRTFDEVVPKLYEKYDFSLNQLYRGLEYIGSEYEKIIEIYNHQIRRKYGFDTSHTYFDCTNFYFEIDREDDWRKKGPSKENRKDPIVGLGLLLDANQIPIGMKLFPGNESEKPVIRKVIDDLKHRNSVTGRTIQIADKGLNCAENIAHALRAGDGYIFSKSVKQLPETEKTWVLLQNDSKDVLDKKSEYGDCAKYVTFSSTDKDGNDTDGKVKVTLNQKLIDKSIELAGYNMLITSEISMSQEAVYNAYHNLWRIEESFRIIKSQLDARPVYLQKKETITGHFLICYIAVLLTRIFQFRIMKNSCSSESVFEFMHGFKLAEISSKKYINLTRDTPFINGLSELTNLPLTNYFLSESDIKKMLSHRF